MVKVEIYGLALDEKGKAPIIILNDLDGKRALPIWIGSSEAMSISMAMNDIPFPRPMTHDLLLNVIEQMGGKVREIAITALEEGTFFSSITVDRDGEVLSVDCRPSDAVALAVRCKADIYVDEDVMASAGMPMEAFSEKIAHKEEADKWSEMLEGLSEDDVKYNM